MEQPTPVVIDNGSGIIKAGFAGEDAPHAYFPSLVGRRSPSAKHLPKDVYIGDYAAAQKHSLSYLESPLEHGVISNWDDMEALWNHIFDVEIRVGAHDRPGRVFAEDQAILMTESPANPKPHRLKTTEIMFEKFKTPGFYLAASPVLTLFSSGRTTGLVVEAGDDTTHIVPIYEGICLSHAMESLPITGRVLSREFLLRLTNERGYTWTCPNYNVLDHMKRELCYVAIEYDKELQKSPDDLAKSYALPDGQSITLDYERFKCPEALFKPALVGRETRGVHEMVAESIHKCDVDLRADFYLNIVFGGAAMLFRGMAERMMRELVAVAPGMQRICVRDYAHRKHSAWVGGSILASLSTFLADLAISKDEYDEFGPSIVNSKCV